MLRCAFLTLEDPTGYVIDDHLAHAPLRALGWVVETIPWSRPGVDWRSFDAVVIRSTWDYTGNPTAFLSTLEEIDRSGTPLFNPLDLVRWNVRKTYLRDLAGRGVSVVPTLWRDRLQPGELPALLDELGAVQAVIKPVIGLNAEGAFLVDAGGRTNLDTIEAHYAARALMLQPFLHTITVEGEYSLFYFDGAFSHAVVKVPKAADFRVQEEHGGFIRPVRVDRSLLEAADAVIRALGGPPLYARVDLVRASDAPGWWLMELELVEPALYFRMDAGAAERFAHALHRRALQHASGVTADATTPDQTSR